MKRWTYLVIVFLCLAGSLRALSAFSNDELRAPPTPDRLNEIERAAAASGWRGLAAPLQAAAFRAYESDSQSTEAWFLLSRWAEIFGTTDAEFLPRWIDTINQLHVNHANMPAKYPVYNQPLSSHVSPALQAWLLANTDFSAEFFSQLSPCDLLTNSFDILSQLQARYPDKFPIYQNLALAIALVYDVPPPTDWPHSQVSSSVLPRRLPAPADAFGFWVRADENGRTLQHLAQLSAAELKFVVDSPTPAAELEWAQTNVSIPLSVFGKIYNIVRYRVDRVQQDQYVWPYDHYDLATIVNKGGICVDQAYFSCEVGKAKGVPTLLFAGAGHDARHAWFGYLDQSRRWQLDAGRYTEEQFITGLAIDPQTWGYLSDHELKFLAEGFRLYAPWRQACLNEDFAAAYLVVGNLKAAARAARAAVSYDSRQLHAWETLLTAESKLGASPLEIENLLREMKVAFRNYPDLEAPVVHQIAASMRARGETSAADFEEEQFAQKVAPTRSDLNLDHEIETIQHSMAQDPIDAQLRTYYALLKSSGSGAGIEFFDRIVRPFAENLKQRGYPREALQAAQQAQSVLSIKPNSQLEEEMNLLLAQLKS
ncbi:MAG TPA: hypothetical protein VMI53_07850 [Opitutaceae bacterium]|nr:hypothetical protein [Opitutaceae bacterium]